jgi:hypothetical protein
MGWFDDIWDKIKDIPKKIGDLFGSIIKGIANVLTSPFGAKIDSPDYNTGQDQRDAIQGVLLAKDSGVANVPIVYGERQLGGIRVFISTNGATNQYLYLALVLCEGQINALTKFLIDDTNVVLNSYAHGVQATPTTGKYANKLVVQFFDGRDDQIASTLLKEAPGWTDNNRLRGLAYLACRFEWSGFNTTENPNNNPYSGGIPNVKAQIQGKKIYDITGGYAPAAIGVFDPVTAGQNGFNWSPLEAPKLEIMQLITFADLAIQNVNNAFGGPGSGDDYFLNFEMNYEGDVELEMSGTIQPLTQMPELRPDGQVIQRFIGQLEKYNPATLNYALFDSTSRIVASQYVEARPVRTQAGNVAAGRQDPSKKNTIVKNFKKTVPAGLYRVRFEQNTVTTYDSQYYRANFIHKVRLIEPERTTDHVETYAQETTVYSKNPVNVLLDYLRNSRYGKGLVNESINWLSWYKAALQCEQTVTYADSTTGKAFTCDAVVDTTQTIMNNCKIIIAGMRGIMPYQQGKYSLMIENGGEDSDITLTPSEVNTRHTITNDDIIGGLSLQGESKETKCNRCVITYVDPLADYQPNEIAYPIDGSADDIAFLAEDDNLRLEKQIALPTIADRKIAEQYARVFVNRSRNQKFISFTTNLSLSNASVGELIRVVDDFIGLDGIFRISEMSVDMNGQIGISATEHQASAYAIGASGSDYTRPTLSLPDPTVVPAVTNLTLNSGSVYDQINNSNSYLSADGVTKRLYASWTYSSPFSTEFFVQFRQSADSDFRTLGTTKTNEVFIPNVTTGTSYDVRVAAVNELGRRSNFTTTSNHVIQA